VRLGRGLNAAATIKQTKNYYSGLVEDVVEGGVQGAQGGPVN
jgi:hypothetical protein